MRLGTYRWTSAGASANQDTDLHALFGMLGSLYPRVPHLHYQVGARKRRENVLRT